MAAVMHAFQRRYAQLARLRSAPASPASTTAQLGLLKVFQMEQVPMDSLQVEPAAPGDALATNGPNSAPVVLSTSDIRQGRAQALLSTMQPDDGTVLTLVVPLDSAVAMLQGGGVGGGGAPAALLDDSPTPPTQAAEAAAGLPALPTAAPDSTLATVDTHKAAPLRTLAGATEGSAVKPPELPGEGAFLADDNELSQGAERPSTPALSSSGRALFQAAELGDVPALLALLESGVDPATQHPRHGGTALHVLVTGPAALEQESLEAGLLALLRAGADVNALAANGSTPLHWAAGAGEVPAVQVLLRAGADPCATTYVWRRQLFGKGSGQTPLHWAAECGHEEVVATLLGWEGPPPQPAWRGGGRHIASAFATPSLAAALIPDERGVLPADLAAKSGHAGTAEAVARVAGATYVALRISCTSQHVGVAPRS